MSARDPSQMTPEELEAWASEPGPGEPELTAVAPPPQAAAPDQMSPDELEAWASAPEPAVPAPPAPPAGPAPGMVTLVDPKGVRSDVPEYQMLTAIAEGKKPVEQYEADQNQAALQAEYGNALGKTAAFTQGVGRGLTLGGTDVLGAGIAGALTPEAPKLTPEYQAKVEAYNKAHPEAPLAGNAAKSAFSVGYDLARKAQQDAAAANPVTAGTGELVGAVAPALVTGGGALALAPAALAERAGAGVASKVLGKGTGIGAKALAGLAGGATEGAIAGGALAASQVAPEIITDPTAAAEHILYGISGGGTIGGIFGGVLHGGAGLLDKGARGLDKVGDGLAPIVKAESPPVHAGNMDEIVLSLESQPVATSLESIAANDQRQWLRKSVEQEQAASGAFAEALDKGTRAISSDLDEYLKLKDEINEYAGIAAKKHVNGAAARSELTEVGSGRFDNIGEQLGVVRGRRAKVGAVNEVAGETPLDQELARQLDTTPKRTQEPIQREMSVRHAEARDVLDHVMEGLEGFKSGLTDQESKGIGPIIKQLRQTRPRIDAAFHAGDLGEAYNLIDQSVKGAMGRVRDSLGENGKNLIEALYPAAKEYLESPQWGSLAERQKMVNPSWAADIKTSLDPYWQSFTSLSGETRANQWDPLRRARPEAVGSMLANVGDATQTRVEGAFRANLRTGARDAVNRAKAFGTPELEDKARRMTELAERMEAEINGVATKRVDAIAGAQARQASSTADLIANAAGAVVPAAGFVLKGTASIKRKLVSAAAEASETVGSQTAKSAAKLVRLVQRGAEGAGKVAAKAAPYAAAAIAGSTPLLTQKKYDAAINEAQALSDPQSPETRALLEHGADIEDHDPQLAQAYVTQQVQRAAYIQSLLPKQLSGAMFARPPIMDPQRARRVAAQVSAAYYPERTLRRLADGTATVEEVKTIRALFPQVYQGFVDQVQAELSRQKGPPSREGAQRLHQLTGIAVTPEQEPANIARQQAQFATQTDAQRMGQAPTQQAQQGMKPINYHAARDAYATKADRLATQ